jgi:hypothetical protein
MNGISGKIMAIADASAPPVAIDLHSASHHEIKLVGATIKNRFIKRAPKRIIGDKAYGSDTSTISLYLGLYLCLEPLPIH